MPNEGTAGAVAEKNALAFLKQRGLNLVLQNYRSRWGEIDLIMRDQNELVFVEVRYRKHKSFGGPEASIDAHKQRRLIKTAETYLQKQSGDIMARFDVVAIDSENIRWIKNAFEA